MDVAKRLVQEHSLTREDALQLLADAKNPETAALLAKEAVKLRRAHYGDKVFARSSPYYIFYLLFFLFT